jgi:hexosaminidase
MDIIPKPVFVRRYDGFFQCSGLPVPNGDAVFQNEIDVFREQLCRDFAGEGAFQTGAEALFCREETLPEGEDAYRIHISPKKITVSAMAGSGMYHGLQSLRQLFLSEYSGAVLRLPCADIRDYPRFSWRGFMLDTSRHFYTPRFIEKIIDTLSLHHINIFHWHLTDDQGWRLPVPEYPLLTEIGSIRLDTRRRENYKGFYTDDDIRRLVSFAAARHIAIIPEVDMPGHACAILTAYPNLGCTGGPYHVEDRFGVFDDVLCAGNDAIFDLAASVFDTLVRLFPSPYVHIGGDEVLFGRWEQCPKCRRRLEETGLIKPRELQSWITVRLVQMLAERDRIAVGWDEILEDSERFPLPKETVVMSWRGTEGGRAARARGHRVVMSPNNGGCYLDYRHNADPEEPGQPGLSTLRQGYHLEPVPPDASKEDVLLTLGGQGNLWSEYLYADKLAEYMIFPRICALAEALWSPESSKNFDDFERRLKIHQKRLDFLGILQYREATAFRTENSGKFPR